MRSTKELRLTTAYGDTTIHVTQLPAMQAGKLLMRLGRTVGPGVAEIAGAVDPSKGIAGIKVAELAGAVRSLFTSLEEAEFERLTRELLSSARATARGEVFDVADNIDGLFTGHLDALFRVLWFALEVNFGNFIGALGVHVPGAVKQAMQGQPPSTSFGLRNG